MTGRREEEAAEIFGEGWQDAYVSGGPDRKWGGDFVIEWRDQNGKVQNTQIGCD